MMTRSSGKPSTGVIAEAVALYLLDPARANPAALEKSPEDILTYLLDVLAAAESMDSLPLVVDYLAWTRGLLANFGLSADDLSRILADMAQSIEADCGFYGRRLADLLRRGWQELDRHPSNAACRSCAGAPLGLIAKRYLAALMGGDEAAAHRVAMESLDRGMTIDVLYAEIVAPVMREVGRLWHANRITVAQEYYISSATQLLMAHLYPRICATECRGPVLVAACVQGELHEMGLRMVADLFQLQGWNTRFLGGDNSAMVVAAFVDHVDADVVAISAMMAANVPAVAAQIAMLRGRDKAGRRKILVGGYPFQVDPDLWRRVGADGSGGDGYQAIEVAHSLLQAGGAPSLPS